LNVKGLTGIKVLDIRPLRTTAINRAKCLLIESDTNLAFQEARTKPSREDLGWETRADVSI
jgi:hypothetical protein